MRVLASIVVLASTLVLAAPVAAQDPASTQRFDEGVEHLRAGRHEEAAAAFRESYRLEPRVATMCNLALTYDRWGPEQRAQAVRAYRACALEDGQGRFGPFAQRRAGEIERDLALEEGRATPEPEDTVVPVEPEPTVEPEPRETVGPEESGPDEGLVIAGSTVLAVAALALAPAIVLALDAQSTVDALHAELGPTPLIVRGSDAHARLRDAETNATAATALYVGAGVAAAAGITLVLIGVVANGGDRHDEGTAAFAIVPTREGVSVAIAGRF